MKKITLTEKDVKRLKQDISDIEAWRGDAYCNDDEVGTAIQDIKTMLSCIIYGNTTEMCPHCEMEQEINVHVAPCPNCGKELVACSLCTMEYGDACKSCKNASNYDIELA